MSNLNDLEIHFLKLMLAKPFQRSPRPKVTTEKLITALGRMKVEVEEAAFLKTMQTLKGRGFVNTQPKILLPDELKTALFEIWITPLGKTNLSNALSA